MSKTTKTYQPNIHPNQSTKKVSDDDRNDIIDSLIKYERDQKQASYKFHNLGIFDKFTNYCQNKARFSHGGLYHIDQTTNDLMVTNPAMIVVLSLGRPKFETRTQQFWQFVYYWVDKITLYRDNKRAQRQDDLIAEAISQNIYARMNIHNSNLGSFQ